MHGAEETVASELAQVAGTAVSGWTSEVLVHNPGNAVTGDIVRVRAGDFSAIVKVLSCDNDGHVPHWHASQEPSHWNYWRREELVYAHDLPARLAGGGLVAPRLLGRFKRSGTEVALWFEDLGAGTGESWSVASLARAARSLGVGQGALAAAEAVPDLGWLSRRFLRDYSTTKPVNWDLIADESAWRQPVIEQYWPASLRSDMERLFSEREGWLTLLEALPRTLCHLDFWPNNLVALDGGQTAAIDWAFAGDGALGEDVGNLVPDAVFDHFLPATALTELDDAVYTSYVEGLREGGWGGDERLVRLAMCASAVKYLFLVPWLLERASDGIHLAYGGAEAQSVELRYGDRGTTLAYLAGWVSEARELAAATGWY